MGTSGRAGIVAELPHIALARALVRARVHARARVCVFACAHVRVFFITRVDLLLSSNNVKWIWSQSGSGS